MADTTWNDLEVAAKEVVMQAARQFAGALAESPQYQAFEQALFTFRQDAQAQSAIWDLQNKQASFLTENLNQSEPFFRYKTAEQRLHADEQAMQLLSDLSAVQQKIRQQQYLGGISQKDLAQLRSLQSAVGTNETIQDHLLTQELAVAFLREVNQTISQ